jgi:hypothetical protein
MATFSTRPSACNKPFGALQIFYELKTHMRRCQAGTTYFYGLSLYYHAFATLRDLPARVAGATSVGKT